MKKDFKEALENSPIIAAIKDDAGLAKCKACDSQVVFVLYGDICSIADIVDEIKSAGKLAMVHLDLITGLSSRRSLSILSENIRKRTESLRPNRRSSSARRSCRSVPSCAFLSLILWRTGISSASLRPRARISSRSCPPLCPRSSESSVRCPPLQSLPAGLSRTRRTS